MQALTTALYRRLADDAQLTGWTAAYGDSPAVFTGDTAPADASLPLVIVRPPASDTPAGTLTTDGREILQDIHLFDEDRGDNRALSAAAERVRELLHHQPLAVEGWHLVFMLASGPTGTPDEAGFMGRAVSIRALLHRT